MPTKLKLAFLNLMTRDQINRTLICANLPAGGTKQASLSRLRKAFKSNQITIQITGTIKTNPNQPDEFPVPIHMKSIT